MKKLKKGDYVINLTEEQFKELIEIENHSIKIPHFGGGFLYYINESLYMHDKKEMKNELSFEEFKQRAIKTFGNGAKK